MNGNARIRLEQPSDHQQVENLTREAFYNVYRPGCVEHYLVRIMRDHPDFLRELAFVLELDGRIIGNIMYTRATLTGQDGGQKHIVTFGPVSIAPAYQRQGYGAKLIRHSLLQAKALGYEAVVIIGSPANYVGLGFKSCKKYNVCTEDGRHPAAMLVCELAPPGAGRANLGIPRQPRDGDFGGRGATVRRYPAAHGESAYAQPRRILYP